jgi:hypothetical protein
VHPVNAIGAYGSEKVGALPFQLPGAKQGRVNAIVSSRGCRGNQQQHCKSEEFGLHGDTSVKKNRSAVHLTLKVSLCNGFV